MNPIIQKNMSSNPNSVAKEDMAWPRDVTSYAMELWGQRLLTVEPYPLESLVAHSSIAGTMGQDHDNLGTPLLLRRVLDLSANK